MVYQEGPAYEKTYKPFTLLCHLLNGDFIIPLHAYLFPKSVITEAGEWNPNLLKNQDGEFTARVLLTSSLVINDKKTYALYRRGNPNSTSQKKDLQSQLGLLNSYFEIYKNILDHRQIDLIKCAGYQFLRFTYENYNTYPELARISLKYASRCEVKIQDYRFPKIFGILSNIFGIKTTFLLRKFFKGT